MTGEWITNSYFQELPMSCGIINSGCHSFGQSFIWVIIHLGNHSFELWLLVTLYPVIPTKEGSLHFKFKYFFNVLDPSFVGMTGKWIINSYYQELPLMCRIINYGCHSFGISFICVNIIHLGHHSFGLSLLVTLYPVIPTKEGSLYLLFNYFFNVLDPSFVGMNCV